mgnify:CR=1 FL=1
MRNILLHIGRHKTGTTAIQHFLWDNRSALRATGWLVPEAGRVNAGHHGFSQALSPGEIAPDQDLTKIKALVQLQRELADVDEQTRVVISSEAFQNCRPKDIGHAFGAYEARVIVYLRNQLDYLPSAYAQRVHATEYQGTLEDYYHEMFRHGLDYCAFLHDWQGVFPDGFTVRRYNPASVLDDFCSHGLGVDLTQFTVREGDSNPSLNSLVTEFKRQLNALPEEQRLDPAAIYFLLPLLNQRFPAPRVQVPRLIADDIIGCCRKPEARVARRYFDDEALFEYRYSGPDEVPVLDENTYRAMEALLQELMAAYPTPASTRHATL